MGALIFERQKLYEEIWTDPVSTVSKRYGLSDNGLRKICKKLGVPLPALGYWAKLRSGQKIKRPPLRKHSGPDSAEAEPLLHTYRESTPPELKAVVAQIQSEEGNATERFQVSPDGLFRVGLVRDLAKNLDKVDREMVRRATERDPDLPSWALQSPRSTSGGIVFPGSGFLHVTVTPSLRPRALAVTDGFLAALIAQGFKVQIGEGKTVISQLDIEMTFRLSEKTEKVTAGFGLDSWKACGLLRLSLRANRYFMAGVPQEMVVRDEPGKPIEQRLNGVIVRLRRSLLDHPTRMAAQEEEARRVIEREAYRAEQARQAAIAAAVAREEKARVDAFFAESDKWDMASRRMAYIDHVEATAGARGMEVDPGSAIGQWVAWARAVCLAIDPTQQRIKILDLEE